MDGKIFFDRGRDLVAAPGQLHEFGCEFFIVARFRQPAKLIGLLAQIRGPHSH